MVTAEDYSSLILRNYSTLIKDIVSWGGEDALDPEFGAVFVSILFEDDVAQETRDATKLQVVDLANQLSIVSFNIRFANPTTTYVETDVYYQFNPKLTDLTSNAVNDLVKQTVAGYFTDNTGKFKQSFRRSNMLTLVDDTSTAVLSSRADVRMQQRFTPSSPNLISVINDIALTVLTETQINKIVNFVTRKRYDDAANYMVNNNLTADNFTTVRSRLASTSVTNSQRLKFPASIAVPDDDNYIVTSNQFVFDGINCVIKNRLSTNTLQIVNTSGTDVIVDNIGSYNANEGTVTINYFNPTNISGGDTQIKLAVVPANQSAISPTRNDFLVYDPNRSSVIAEFVSATN
jgi:hypothetical protein